MKLANEPIFHRAKLAQHFVEYIQSPDSSSGLFLAAPRRTGKTTFIKEDLIPLLRENGATVIYADLWEDKAVNPSVVIINAIRQAILETDGLVMKAAKSAGLVKFKVGGFEMDLGKIGAKDGDSTFVPMMLLTGADHSLSLYAPTNSTVPAIVFNPDPAVGSRVNGPLRVAPAGDLLMGDFTTGPKPDGSN